MTLKEFVALLRKDKVLQQKFLAARNALTEEELKDKGTALFSIIQKLGYDVSAEEIALGLIGAKRFDENEMESVAGGSDFICYVKDNWLDD